MSTTLPVPVDAATLGVSEEALALTRAADVIDLHIDTYIPPRLWGYDPLAPHARSPLGGRFFGHLDLPKLEATGVTGAPHSAAQSRKLRHSLA